ncbi:hypothetical protein [Arsenicicoccus dermatophilus]|uniref:hypothetical protein n=1 Tax=Arsenicicoccus dermatophilus TaxID=1076331 RepID=UPI0039175B35
MTGSRPARWVISCSDTPPGWLLHVVVATLLTCAPLWHPTGWQAWVAAAVGSAALASAFAFRHRLEDADAWRTGEPVAVRPWQYAWIQLHKAPFLVIMLGGLALRTCQHLTHWR